MTGFRVDSPIAKVFRELRTQITAKEFAPDVEMFLKKSLTKAIQLTPARSISEITRNQKRQYKRRINYIPSVHDLIDPTLIVTETGEQWMFANDKWWRPDQWQLPDEIWGIYEALRAERDRRLRTSEEDFIRNRAQARFLYKRSWYEIGISAGLNIPCSDAVKNARTRRKPPVNPPRGYVQKRGGKGTYSIVVYNPFLNQSIRSRYGPGNPEQIINQAMAENRSAFDERVAKRQTAAILRILRSLL